jgi:protein-tyrosine phosphatase
MNNFDSLIKFLENGCLVQIDAASVVGVYGTEARHIAEKLIKLNLAQFVASDAHCPEDYCSWYLPAYKQVKRWVGVEYTDQLFNENAKKIATGIRNADSQSIRNLDLYINKEIKRDETKTNYYK